MNPVQGSPRTTGLEGARVVLAIGGGIAAYKAAELARLLIKRGAQVQAVMTRAAQEFITPLTLQTLTGRPVATHLFDLTQESEIGHIRLATEADLWIVAPATADLLSKMAHGAADDVVTAALLVTRAPVLCAPAMNVQMWEHPLVQENVATLARLGRVHFVGPGAGFLACRMVGPGRLAEPADIVEAAEWALSMKDLQGTRILVSAGPTRESVDPVRFLSNRSSGKMGYALARAAALRGAQVTLVSGPTDLLAPAGVDVVQVQTAADMEREIVERAPDMQVLCMAAAVADYRPSTPAPDKLKKESLGDTMRLELVRTGDVLAHVATLPKRPFVIGFAAETQDVEARARDKRRRKGCDLIVANDVSRADIGFDSDHNEVMLIGPDDQTRCLPRAPKERVAHGIWDAVMAIWRGR